MTDIIVYDIYGRMFDDSPYPIALGYNTELLVDEIKTQVKSLGVGEELIIKCRIVKSLDVT